MLQNFHQATPEYWMIRDYLIKNPDSTCSEIATALRRPRGEIASIVSSMRYEGKAYQSGRKMIFETTGVSYVMVNESTWRISAEQ